MHQGPCHLVPGACFRCGQFGHFAKAYPNYGFQQSFTHGSSSSVAQPSYQVPQQYPTQFVSQQSRGRATGRGFAQPSTSQQAGRGQARVFTLTPQDAQASNAVVAGTIPVCCCDARVLFDPGATHSFITSVFASKVACQPSRMLYSLSVATPLSEELETNVFFPSCPVLVEGRELPTDLVLLDVIGFDVILGMDWLAQYYATVDCREKEVIFRIPDENEFRFRGDKSLLPQNLISAITARKMLRRGCQGYLAVVRDV